MPQGEGKPSWTGFVLSDPHHRRLRPMIRLSYLRRLCACLALTVAAPLASAQSASSSTGDYTERPIRLLLGQAGGE